MQRYAIDFGSDNIPKLFGKMLMPTLLGMLCISLMTIIDGVFIGHGVGSDALAAVNIFSPFWLLMTAIGLMLGIGCSVVSSIHLSRDNEKAARINMTQTIIFGTALTLTITILVQCYSTQTAYLLGSSDRLLPHVLDYQRWLSLAFCAMFIQSVGLLIIRLDGSPTYAMFTSSIPAILNIVLDYIFLFVLDKGLAGVSFATFLALWFGAGMVIFYILFLSRSMKLYRLKWSLKSLCLFARNIGYQFRLGFSAFLGECSISVLMFVGNYVFMRYLGEDGVAAFSIACYIMPFIFMTGNAISQSAQPIISFNHGAGKRGRVVEARKVALLTAAGAGILLSSALAFGVKYVAALFLSTDTAGYRIASAGIPLMSAGFVFYIVNVTVIGYFQSVERVWPATIYSLARGLVFLVPSFLIMPHVAGTPGIWLALPVSEALTFILISATRIINRSSRKKRKMW